jgi:hypothetical protein
MPLTDAGETLPHAILCRGRALRGLFHVRLLIAAATRHTAAPRAILRIRSISAGGISLRVKLDPRIADLYMHRLGMPGM